MRQLRNTSVVAFTGKLLKSVRSAVNPAALNNIASLQGEVEFVECKRKGLNMWRSVTVALILFGSSLPELPALAGDLPPQIQAGEHRLFLNGEGARTKALLELYVAGLYLKQPSANAAQIIAADEPMAIRIKITSSFVSQKSLVDSLEEGFRNAMGGDPREIRNQIEEFRDCFKDAIAKGDTFDMVYLPMHGVIVNKNGKLKGAVAGTKFKQALFSIWLSNKPADATLKQALLTTGMVR